MHGIFAVKLLLQYKNNEFYRSESHRFLRKQKEVKKQAD